MSYNPDSLSFKKGMQDALDNQPYLNESNETDYQWGYIFIAAKHHRRHGLLNTSLLDQLAKEVQERYLIIFNKKDDFSIDNC